MKVIEVTGIDSEFREYIEPPESGTIETRTLVFTADASDTDTRSTLFEILKARLNLPGNGICSVRVSIGVKEITTVEVKYYHLVDGRKVAGVSP